MWIFWQYHGPVWKPADEGSGGNGEGEGEGQGDNASEGGEGQGDGEGTGDKPPARSSILDFADKGKKAEGDGEGEGEPWKLPEGLEVPDHLMGSTAEDTLAKVTKAYQGARRELSNKGKGDSKLEGEVPESPDGYQFEPEGDDDKVAAELNSEASKPYVDAFRKAAHDLGIPDKAFSALMRQGLAGIAEGGIPIGASDGEAQQISADAEMKALTDEVGALEAGTIVNTAAAYGEKLVQKGILQSEEDIAEYAQMIGTARSARIFHRMLTGEFGEKPIPPADGADGSITAAEAYAKHNAALAMPQGAERDAALQSAQKAMQKAFGNQPSATGSVRSSVL